MNFLIFKNKKFLAFLGGGMLVVLTAVLGLAVWRVQNLKPTVTMPKAVNPSSCPDAQMPCLHQNSGGAYDCCDNCNAMSKSYDSTAGHEGVCSASHQCWYYNLGAGNWQISPVACNTSSGGGGTSYTASSPIGGAPVSSLTPTFSWSGVPAGAAYQVICVGSYADGHPPGSCNFVNCTADFAPSTTSYTMSSSLAPNTEYHWMVYSQPGGNPAPSTGCQSFKTPNIAAATHLACDSATKTCTAVSGGGGNTDGCTAPGASCGTVTCSGSTPDLCGSTCTNKQTDANNCGGCGTACSTGQTCSNAQCSGSNVCSNSYKMAFIVAARNSSEITQGRIDIINKIKNALPAAFSVATSGLGRLDTSTSIINMVDDPQDSFIPNGTLDVLKMAKKFYASHPDDFDFITSYSTFEPQSVSAGHFEIRNPIKGIGITASSDDAQRSGSQARLLGINHMGNVDTMSVWDDGGIAVAIHETEHQWCCSLGQTFNPNSLGSLPVLDGTGHWYHGFSVNTPTREPLEAQSFVANGDGTYRLSDFNASWKVVYHPFALYFMGLLDSTDITEKFSVYNIGTPPNNADNSNFRNAPKVKDVSITDVVAVGGQRSCIAPKPSGSHLECQNSSCVSVSGSGGNTGGCAFAGGSCTTGSNEVTACQGNGGTNGKCYDCNGDGVVNIIDFSCFRTKYGNSVTRS